MKTMETFSTVLFMNHAPVGYRVQQTPGRLELHPADNPLRSETPPRMVAEKTAGRWQVQGTDNADLIHQVLLEINMLERSSAGITLSAAP
jgi:hypothetical protein